MKLPTPLKNVLIFLSLVLFVFVQVPIGNAQIGWISDIHAGSAKKIKRITNGTGTIYPRKGTKNFKFYLKGLKRSGINTVIVTGDITNKGKRKYAKKMLSHARKYGIQVFWVKGNHDSDRIMSTLGSSSYYAVEMEKWKVIVLDTYSDPSRICSSIGCLDAEQLEWLRGQLETDKKILVAMHHPPYDIYGNFNSSYSEFEDIIKDKVDLVINGHLHTEMKLTINGIEHRTADAFSEKNKPSYILDVR